MKLLLLNALKHIHIAVISFLLIFSAGARSNANFLAGAYGAHDPSRIIKCGGTYYYYCTGPNMPMHYSTDLTHWKDGEPVFTKDFPVPAWTHKYGTDKTANFIWAPDIIFYNNEYYLYYSLPVGGANSAVIGLLTNPTLDPNAKNYKWTDKGLIINSGPASVFNAIDPCPVLDQKGGFWMSFGSWANGIWLLQLNPKTGLRISADSTLYDICKSSMEASYIHYHDGNFYLFENMGTCCSGLASTYHIMMGRSKEITGPFVDKNGILMTNGGGTLFMERRRDKFGPGHVGIINVDGKDMFTYHYYDVNGYGAPMIGLNTLMWGKDGWPIPGDDIPEGIYRIKSKATGYFLGVKGESRKDGDPLDSWTEIGSLFQEWYVHHADNLYYSIQSLGNNKMIDVFECKKEDGTLIDCFPWFNNDCQKWIIDQQSDGTYSIQSVGGGGALTLSDKEKGTIMIEKKWQGLDIQKWIFDPVKE